jgi:hypothetical protein
LAKYRDGADIDEEDTRTIDELASIGLINTGISTRRQKLTAKTTSMGLGLMGWK